MNKLISKIVGVFLGLTLAAGTGVAIATNSNSATKAEAVESSVTFSLTSSTNRTTISTSLIKYESNNVSFSIIKGTGTNVNNYCPDGSTNNTTQTRVYNGNSVEFVAPTGKVVTKVEVTATGSGYFAGLNTAAQYSPAASISTSGNTATATFAAAVQAFIDRLKYFNYVFRCKPQYIRHAPFGQFIAHKDIFYMLFSDKAVFVSCVNTVINQFFFFVRYSAICYVIIFNIHSVRKTDLASVG